MPPRKPKKPKEESPQIEVPPEYLTTDDSNFKFNTTPEWLSSREILPSLDPFPLDSDFYVKLHPLYGKELSSNDLKLVFKLILGGNFDTEAKYVWLICCITRILLQKDRSLVYLVMESDILDKYNCASLYEAEKLHQITREVFRIVKGNTFGIVQVVSKLNHVNPVLNYLCIALVSAGVEKIHAKKEPEVFRAMTPGDVAAILAKTTMAGGDLDFVTFYEMLKLVSLYNCLVVMSRQLPDMHPENLRKYLGRGRQVYVDAVKKWLQEASGYVDKEMAQKKFCAWLVDLKQQIVMEMQYGLRDAMEDTVKVFKEEI